MINLDSDEEWKVYMIRTESGKLYTGITNDIARRFDAHKNQQKGAKFFHFSEAKEIVFLESYPNRSEATKREIAIKKLSRKEKEKLI